MNINRNFDARKRGVAIPVIVAGALSSVLLAFSMTPTFSALAASIQNTANSAGSGTLTMQETNTVGGAVCDSTTGSSISTNVANCTTINNYGGSVKMVPGDTVTTNITIKNTGSVTATAFTLAGGTCAQAKNGSVSGTATDMCSKMKLVVMSGTKEIFNGNAKTFETPALNINTLLGSPVAAGATVPFSFAVTLDSAADNSYQGLMVSQPMTFTFGA